MGHSAGQSANGLHFLRLQKLFFQLFSFGYIIHHHQLGTASAKCDEVGADFHVDDGPILLFMFPRLRVKTERRGLSPAFHAFHEREELFWRTDVLDGHVKKFSQRISIMVKGSIIHSEESQRSEIKNPHGMWVGLEKQAVLLF